jgi:hypothetical protein
MHGMNDPFGPKYKAVSFLTKHPRAYSLMFNAAFPMGFDSVFVGPQNLSDFFHLAGKTTQKQIKREILNKAQSYFDPNQKVSESNNVCSNIFIESSRPIH